MYNNYYSLSTLFNLLVHFSAYEVTTFDTFGGDLKETLLGKHMSQIRLTLFHQMLSLWGDKLIRNGYWLFRKSTEESAGNSYEHASEIGLSKSR